MVAGAFPYLLALLAISALAWFVWHGIGPTAPDETVVSEVSDTALADALALAEAGDLEMARKAMHRLAPLEGALGGNVEAHWWLARDILRVDVPAGERQVEREGLETARQHLECVVRRDPDKAEAPPLLAQTYLFLGKQSEALAMLEKQVSRHPELHLISVVVAAQLGDRARVEKHARAASIHFEAVCESDGDPAVEARLRWAEAEWWLRHFEKMRDIVRAGGAAATSPESKALLLKSWLAQVSMIHSQADGDLSAMAFLEEALAELGPHAKLVETASALAGRAKAALKKRLLRFYETVAQPTEDSEMALALGSLALALDKRTAGMAYLEKTLLLEPNHIVALNNLGYCLAYFKDPPELNRALELINHAVKVGKAQGSLPTDCLETRGQILAKLERWREAVVDLERALQGMAGNAEIHRTLAKVYKKLGHAELALKHLELGNSEEK